MCDAEDEAPAVKSSLCLFSSFLVGDDELIFGQIFHILYLVLCLRTWLT